MPAPVGQSCQNCFYVEESKPGTEDMSRCLFDKPSSGPTTWPPVKMRHWCGMWRDTTTGSSGLNDYDSAVGYRGNNDTGHTMPLDGNWTLLRPTFASITNTRNFALDSAGVMRLDITTGTVTPTLEIYVTVNAIVAFQAATNSETIELTIGQNGTPDDNYSVPFGIRTAGMIAPIPSIAGLAMKNGDTFALYARDRSSPTNATFTAYHMDRLFPSMAMVIPLWLVTFGLVGSYHHVGALTEEERDDLFAYLNFDMVGSPNGASFIYDGDGSITGYAWASEASGFIEQQFIDWMDASDAEGGARGEREPASCHDLRPELVRAMGRGLGTMFVRKGLSRVGIGRDVHPLSDPGSLCPTQQGTACRRAPDRS